MIVDQLIENINTSLFLMSKLDHLRLICHFYHERDDFPFFSGFLLYHLYGLLVLWLQFFQYQAVRKLFADVHVHVPEFRVYVLPFNVSFWIVQNVLLDPLLLMDWLLGWLSYPQVFKNLSLFLLCNDLYWILRWIVLLVEFLALSPSWFNLTKVWLLSRLLKVRLFLNVFIYFWYFALYIDLAIFCLAKFIPFTNQRLMLGFEALCHVQNFIFLINWPFMDFFGSGYWHVKNWILIRILNGIYVV